MVDRAKSSRKVNITMEEFIAANTPVLYPQALSAEEIGKAIGAAHDRLRNLITRGVNSGQLVEVKKIGRSGKIIRAYLTPSEFEAANEKHPRKNSVAVGTMG